MAESCCFSSTSLVLPEDVILQILIWLPVLSLLRFKSVCTSWYSLIQSSYFIQRHATTTAVVNSKLGGTFICQREALAPTPQFYLLSDKGFMELEDLGKQPCFKDARRPHAINMADSVHGIICMYNKITRDIVLWNPATRRFRLLPKSLDGNPKDGYDHRDFVGLGFDVETKDYKVIQVSSLEPRNKNGLTLGLNILRKVHIYCLSTDSWRLIDSDFRTHCCSPALQGRSLNGIYFHQGLEYTAEPNEYWTENKKLVILSFDLSKENYQRVLQIPENNLLHLESIGDKLACITYARECSRLYKVWILNDYNKVTELWTELYRVVVPMSPEHYTRYNGCYSMLTISWNGQFGLFKGKTLVRYNSITDEFEDLGFGEGLDMFTFSLRANIYKESLVSVDANEISN